jgi:hypothetical protein
MHPDSPKYYGIAGHRGVEIMNVVFMCYKSSVAYAQRLLTTFSEDEEAFQVLMNISTVLTLNEPKSGRARSLDCSPRKIPGVRIQVEKQCLLIF